VSHSARDSAALTNVVAGGLLAAMSATLSLEAVSNDAIAQDWLPFRVAASLAPSSRWSDIYPDGAISQLFDVPPAFRAAAAAHVEREGPLAITGNTLTAFVSPPPAAFLLSPMATVSSPTALRVSRLALALPLVATMIVFAAVGCRNPDMRLRWSLLCLVAYPLLSYTIGIGQPSAWLFSAAVASLVTVAWVDVIGGVALGLAAVTKATPIGVAIALILLGRRRLGEVALAVAVLATVLTAPQSGVDAWRRFASVASHIGRSVVPDWNNASIDADLIRWLTGRAVASFTTPGTGLGLTLVALKMTAIGALFWLAWRCWREPSHRIASIWIAWLVLSPMLWLHYLVVLVPLAGTVPRQRFPVVLLSVAALSLSLVIRTRVNPVVLGHIVTLAWLVTALAVTWRTRLELELQPASLEGRRLV
jgi:hypothetical protein